jgi:hypothetical protein
MRSYCQNHISDYAPHGECRDCDVQRENEAEWKSENKTPSATKRPKRPTARHKGLGDTTLLHLRLTAAQADWLRSTASREAISIASVVRGMIDAERQEPSWSAPPDCLNRKAMNAYDEVTE